MADKRIGIVAAGSDSGAILADIERAEQMGIPAAWLTTGGGRTWMHLPSLPARQ